MAQRTRIVQIIKAVHLFFLIMLCYVPITNETSLGKFKALDKATNGADIPETIMGPIKVRRTTPGHSKWFITNTHKSR